MTIQVDYPLGITGLTLTGTIFLEANGDAAGIAITFTENTHRLGRYLSSVATIAVGPAWIRIVGGIIDSMFVIIPASGIVVAEPSYFDVTQSGGSALTIDPIRPST